LAYRYPFEGLDEKTKRAVWNRSSPIPDYPADKWGRDICGHAMKYSDHGKEGDYGWEIDHIKPSSKGGSDFLDNLQPLWWKHNRQKGYTYPWSCPKKNDK
jgi:5-methylcytosine-specific restriction endonuclease McrA